MRSKLVQSPSAAQVCAQPPEWMAAGNLVAAIQSNKQQRVSYERICQRRHEFERGVVCPLQVVKQDDNGLIAGYSFECAANRFKYLSAAAGRGWLSQLRRAVRTR